ncbi:hypothetical protein NBRC116495_05630 [Aurantivibrio plasticivorans]
MQNSRDPRPLNSEDHIFLELAKTMSSEQKRWLIDYGKRLNNEYKQTDNFLEDFCNIFPGVEGTPIYHSVERALQTR